MEQDIPKSIKKDLRSLVGLAHEAELGKALEDLRGHFETWKAGKINSFDLADLVHKFHDGPNREIYLRYTGRVDPRYLVQYALEEGLLERTTVPKEVWPYLEGFSILR